MILGYYTSCGARATEKSFLAVHVYDKITSLSQKEILEELCEVQCFVCLKFQVHAYLIQ